ncbi:MAG: tryptophan synthase subunit alpha [Thermanaeromonas sp.]|uniref:tryptophan synthase subunit alpha n=1 Tax=Thermanaeromonas sp. TaxID=2003697 RepID=UPI0024389E5F|nr:tryptophan synthase subunit alpha [Thermanaeromonas sp.]MCG0278004.1 tryptophan synthase subunit alpha [Thermanaeromonas sp.]
MKNRKEQGKIKLLNSFRRGRKALIVYLCAGDPSLEATFEAVCALTRAGADIVELGVPFSDPLADGPVIQAASQRALDQGTTLGQVLKLTHDLRKILDIPLVLMSYYNPLLRYGLASFVRELAEAGGDGVIVPDLPHEEAGPLRDHLDERGLALVPLVAPTTPVGRLQEIARQASGFIYCVSLTGVTGPRDELPPDLAGYLSRVRRVTSLPLAIGFGISTPEQARRIASLADGIIVGSAVVETLAEQGIDKAVNLVQALRKALE